ncbi:MAG: hypothetical protein Q9220_001443 [cf. Caloplaca sp. 1 TL-2023]
MDIIHETPTKRRKLDLGYTSSDRGYKSDDDDDADHLFAGYETVDTLPLPPITRNSSSPLRHITQPTQVLSRVTPTPERHVKPSVVQVAASSPLPTCSPPRPSPEENRPPAAFQNRTAAVEISSDDDEMLARRGGSPDEDSQSPHKADIRPSEFVHSGQNRTSTAGPARFREITTQAFYKPLEDARKTLHPVTSVARSIHDPRRYEAVAGPGQSVPAMASSYGGVSRPPKVHQTASVKTQSQQDMTLDEIEDYQVRTKVDRMHKIFPAKGIAACKAALLKKRGNFDDAMDYLASSDDTAVAIDLTLSDTDRSMHKVTSFIKPAAKQKLKAPVKSIQSKWTTPRSFEHRADPASSPPPRAATPKPRRRLVQGRKNGSPTPAIIPRESNLAALEDTDPEDSNARSDSGIGSGSYEDESERRLLVYLNECSSDQLVDIAAVTESVASLILSHKPFKSLDVVRRITSDKVPSKKRNNKRPIGDKVIDTCLEVWRGYDAVDGLVLKCESIGRPVAEQIKKWGTDVYGAANDGELNLIEFDKNSEPEASLRDSGIGTPTSVTVSADEDGEGLVTAKSDTGSVFGQPRLLNDEVTLKDYQIVGVNWLSLLFHQRLSCILADDMGLGKTCQVIAFLAHLFEKGNHGPHLIIVPGSTIENWLREFRVFCSKLSVMPYYAGQVERVAIRDQIERNQSNINVIVTTYGVAKAKDDCKFLRRLPLQVCVYDEGHMLKNRKSAAYEQLTRFSCSFRLLLTGTPLQNNLSELVSLLAFIMPQMFREHSEDLDVIFSQKAKTSSESHAALLSAQRINRARAMMAPFVLRRKKHQVLRHLPKKVRRVEYCDLSPSQAEMYDREKARGLQVVARRAAGEKVGNETANVMMALRKASIHPLLFRRVYNDQTLKKMARACLAEDDFRQSQFELCLEDMSVMMDFELQRFCERYPTSMSRFRLRNDEWMDSGKVSKLAELLVQFRKSGDRVLVFSQFVMVMDILEDVMETLGMRFFRLDGQTKIEERQDMLDQFHAETDITVFLLSTKAGGAGINLACANKVIIFDSSFNPQDDIQAENRAHRVGQTREVEVVRLVTRGTIEEQIHALGQTKLALDDRVAGDGETAAMAIEDEKQADQQGQRAVEQMMIEQMKEQ